MKKKIIGYSFILFIIDLVSKLIIDRNLMLNETISIINDFFSITKVYNTGASFSMLMGYKYLFIIIAIIVIYLFYKSIDNFKSNKRNIIAFSLTIGGIFGNLIDRVFYGYVIDFFDFKLFGENMPIFNFADTFICIGVALFFYAILKKEDNYEVNSK